jgi:hypothetical protein
VDSFCQCSLPSYLGVPSWWVSWSYSLKVISQCKLSPCPSTQGYL